MKKIIFFTIIIIAIIIFLILFLSSLKKLPKIQPNKPTPNITLPTTIVPTSSFPPVTPARDQGGADKNYSNQMQYVFNKYPWYKKLPLQTINYFVYFDFNKQEMVGEMYAGQNSLTQEQVANYKKSVDSQLSSLGVDLQKYPVDWQIDK